MINGLAKQRRGAVFGGQGAVGWKRLGWPGEQSGLLAGGAVWGRGYKRAWCCWHRQSLRSQGSAQGACQAQRAGRWVRVEATGGDAVVDAAGSERRAVEKGRSSLRHIDSA